MHFTPPNRYILHYVHTTYIFVCMYVQMITNNQFHRLYFGLMFSCVVAGEIRLVACSAPLLNVCRSDFVPQEDGPLYKFNEAIMDSGDVFMNTINNLKDVTLFAPSNKAWMDANLQNVIRFVYFEIYAHADNLIDSNMNCFHFYSHRDKEKMSEILNLHIIRDRLTTDRIRQSNANAVRCLEAK